MEQDHKQICKFLLSGDRKNPNKKKQEKKYKWNMSKVFFFIEGNQNMTS